MFGSQLNTRYVFAITIVITIMVIIMAYTRYLEYQNMRASLYINAIAAETSPQQVIAVDNGPNVSENFMFVYKMKPKKFVPELTDSELMNLQ